MCNSWHWGFPEIVSKYFPINTVSSRLANDSHHHSLFSLSLSFPEGDLQVESKNKTEMQSVSVRVEKDVGVDVKVRLVVQSRYCVDRMAWSC